MKTYTMPPSHHTPRPLALAFALALLLTSCAPALYTIPAGQHSSRPRVLPVPRTARVVAFDFALTSWPQTPDRAWGKVGGAWNQIRLGVAGKAATGAEAPDSVALALYSNTPEGWDAVPFGMFALPVSGTCSIYDTGDAVLRIPGQPERHAQAPRGLTWWFFRARPYFGGAKYPAPATVTIQLKYK